MAELDMVQRDLAVFADPGTDLAVDTGIDKISISMTRRGEDLRVQITPGGVLLCYDTGEQRFKSLGSLLASDRFSNLRGLVATQRRLALQADADPPLEPCGTIGDDEHGSLPLSLEKLNSMMLGNAGERLRVFLVDGRAGVGKTFLIKQLCRLRTQDPLAPPLLHVESRGSRLVILSQILATTLQSLRADFTFDQVPILIRHGLLQVAIDGFDELVDNDGYADAWGSLRDFFGEIGGQGLVLLAARDTFFDIVGFERKLSGLSHKIDFSSVRVFSVTPSAAQEYLRIMGWSEAQLSSPEAREILHEGSYALRPFFLRTLAKYSTERDWHEITEKSSLRTFLVDVFVAREANLLRSRTDLSTERTRRLLTQVFSELAMEMAATETYLADIDFIELVVESVFVEDLAGDIGRLKHKAGSFGFLESDDSSRTVRQFPHTEIFYHFLAEGLLDNFPNAGSQRTLRRASLEADFLTIFSERFQEISEVQADNFFSALNTELSVSRGVSDRYENNIISLWFAALSRRLRTQYSVRLSDKFVSEAVVTGRAVQARLTNVTINRLDVRGADLSLVEFNGVFVNTLIADVDSRFGETTLVADHIQLVTPSAVEDLRGPDAINWLQQRAPKVDINEIESDAADLLKRVLFALTKRFAIRDNSEDPAGRLLRDQFWDPIEKILAEYGRIYRTDRKDVSGPNDFFLRVRDPRGLLWKSDPEAKEIWRRVSNLG